MKVTPTDPLLLCTFQAKHKEEKRTEFTSSQTLRSRIIQRRKFFVIFLIYSLEPQRDSCLLSCYSSLGDSQLNLSIMHAM